MTLKLEFSKDIAELIRICSALLASELNEEKQVTLRNSWPVLADAVCNFLGYLEQDGLKVLCTTGVAVAKKLVN